MRPSKERAGKRARPPTKSLPEFESDKLEVNGLHSLAVDLVCRTGDRTSGRLCYRFRVSVRVVHSRTRQFRFQRCCHSGGLDHDPVDTAR